MRPETTIHDAETGETITREMTEQEYAKHKLALKREGKIN